MVLTDVPFSRPNLIQDRYNLLLRPGEGFEDHSSSEEEDDNQEHSDYAKFLKALNKKGKNGGRDRPHSDGPTWLRDKERMAGPDGFVDSARQQNRYKRDKTEPKGKSARTSKVFTVVDLAAIKEKDQKEFEKRKKVIDDHMWQHKQEERELKRFEGDVIKNQRAVRKEMRDYENAITRKRLAEEKKLNQGLERFTDLQKHHVHKKEDISTVRKDQNMNNDHSSKDQGRKVQLTTSDLARQYRTKVSELDLKRTELERINEDFETKLRRKEVRLKIFSNSLARQYRTKVSELELKRVELGRINDEFETKLRKKEEEQYKLKQELAELAIALNMEAQKGRVQTLDYKKEQEKQRRERIDTDFKTQNDLDSKLAKSDGVTKAAINEKRKLSANLSLTRAHLQLKQREENRSKYDTEQQLKLNREEQRKLNEASMHADLDLKQKKIDQKITEVNSRKHVQMMTTHTQKKDAKDHQETTLSHKFAKRLADQNRREHEDHLKHFQKSVQMGEEQEYLLYNKVKNAEYARQKQEKSVRKLNTMLLERKRENAQKLKREMLDATKEELEIQYKLERERAELQKVHAQREEMYTSLQKHRVSLNSDRHLLTKHEREHERLRHIGMRTEQEAAAVGV